MAALHRGNLTLSVRYNSSIPRPVSVDRQWTVLQLKEEIAKVHEVELSEVKLVFQGKELDNNMLIQDMDLGNFSVLDAVKHRGLRSNIDTLEAIVPEFVRGVGSVYRSAQGLVPPTAPAPAPPTAAGDAAAGPMEGNKIRSFYVYCKQCADVKPGKLRVRCKDCKRMTLLLSGDPHGWDDVLQRDRMHGACEIDGCEGTVAEFIFKCAAGHQVGEDETSVVLPQVKTNVKAIPCIICTETYDEQIVYDCPAMHTICFGCFHQYAVTMLGEKRFVLTEQHGYSLPCPGDQDGCSTAFTPDPHYFHLMGDKEYERYKRFGTEEFVQNMMGGLICPAPDCGQGIVFEGNGTHVICRPGCGYEFCKLCNGPYHQGSCEISRRETLKRVISKAHIDPEAANRARWMLADIEKIEEISKPCPNCNVRIEKNDGCMHMTCTQCSHDFCWLCLTPWGTDCQENHWFS